jgi:transcriptional regulator with XRE-family HTH domain
MSEADLAAALNVSPQTIRNWQKKPKTIPLGKLMQICGLFKIKPEQIKLEEQEK